MAWSRELSIRPVRWFAGLGPASRRPGSTDPPPSRSHSMSAGPLSRRCWPGDPPSQVLQWQATAPRRGARAASGRHQEAPRTV